MAKAWGVAAAFVVGTGIIADISCFPASEPTGALLELTALASRELSWSDPIRGVAGTSELDAVVLWSATGSLSIVDTEKEQVRTLPPSLFVIGAELSGDGTVELMDEEANTWLLTSDGTLARRSSPSTSLPSRATTAAKLDDTWVVLTAEGERIYLVAGSETTAGPRLGQGAFGLQHGEAGQLFVFERRQPFRIWNFDLTASTLRLKAQPTTDFDEGEWNTTAVIMLGNAPSSDRECR